MNALTTQQKRMVEDNLYLAEIAANKARLRNMNLNRDECLASAAYGLMDAASRYDKSKGSFSTSGSIRAKYQITDDLRDKTRWFNYGPRKTIVTPVAIPANLRKSHEGFAKVDSAESFEVMIAPLKEREKRVLRKCFIEDLDRKEIAKSEGLTESSIYLIRRDAVAKLRKLL